MVVKRITSSKVTKVRTPFASLILPDNTSILVDTCGRVIGRRDIGKCVSFEDAEYISRKHVHIFLENNRFKVEDGYKGTPSANGTVLNGKLLKKSEFIRHGDEILLAGKVRLRFQAGCVFCGNFIPLDKKKCPLCARDRKVPPTTIEEIFLLHKNGLLIKHYTRRLKPTVDEDIVAGMLIAIQSFVKDSLKEPGTLDEIKYGNLKIYLTRGKYLILALIIAGEDTENIRARTTRMIEDIESAHGKMLKKWKGEMNRVAILDEYMKTLIERRCK